MLIPKLFLLLLIEMHNQKEQDSFIAIEITITFLKIAPGG